MTFHNSGKIQLFIFVSTQSCSQVKMSVGFLLLQWETLLKWSSLNLGLCSAGMRFDLGQCQHWRQLCPCSALVLSLPLFLFLSLSLLLPHEKRSLIRDSLSSAIKVVLPFSECMLFSKTVKVKVKKKMSHERLLEVE